MAMDGRLARGGGVAVRLTARQYEILMILPETDSREEAAERLGITYQTLKNTLNKTYRRLGVTSIVAAYYKLGWLKPEERLICDFVGKCERVSGHRGHHGNYGRQEVA